MNHISFKKLYNPQYDLLSINDKEELLSQIGKIYNLELLCFDEFDAFGKSTYTAIYRSYDGIDFVFVPGDTVISVLILTIKSCKIFLIKKA